MSEERFFEPAGKSMDERKRDRDAAIRARLATDNKASHAIACTLVQVSPSPKRWPMFLFRVSHPR
jgi:hypothetical protein